MSHVGNSHVGDRVRVIIDTYKKGSVLRYAVAVCAVSLTRVESLLRR